MDGLPELSNKTAVVTGAGRGIGRETARVLAACGASVIAAARTTADLAETARLVEAAGGRIRTIPTDVADAGQVAHLFEEAVRWKGGVDILVNCAGAAPLGTIEGFSEAQFDLAVDANVRSVFLCCKAAWPQLARGGGVIINVSSIAALDPFPGFAVYGGCKAFVNTYTQALATEGRERSIRVFGVAPGAVETGMLRGAFPDFPREQAMSPAEVARFIALLTSPTCQFASGQTIVFRK